MSLGKLRTLIGNIIKESSEFYDSSFVDDIVPELMERGLLPDGIGDQLDSGNEAVIYEFGPDRVIRLHPTYEAYPEQVDKIVERMKNAPKGSMYVKIFDVGRIEGYDEDFGEDVTYAVYTVMERLTPLTPGEADAIDGVVTNRMDLNEIEPDSLRNFLEKYVELPIDQDSRNVMKRGDDYVIIDPE